MSYMQEAKAEMHHESLSPQHRRGGLSILRSISPTLNSSSIQRNLYLLLCLAFLHGTLYAIYLPPWGLIDESQHFHYIQYIAENQSLPVMSNELYLSEEIIDSLFDTQRWQTFHWTPPVSADPLSMGLEGYSYETYQPPFYYLVMTPVYWALPQDILVKVYALRLVMVALSLITVWAMYRTAMLLFPRFLQLPFWAAFVLVAIPERTMATSRINNDGLLEVTAALFFLLLTYTLLKGVTVKRALLLGLLVGIAAWIKLPGGLLVVPLAFLFVFRRHHPQMMRSLLAASIVVPMGLLLVVRNLWLYGGVTGFNAFDELHRLSPVDTSLVGIAQTLFSLPNHFWVVWWKGGDVGTNWLITLFYIGIGVLVIVAWVRLLLHLRQRSLLKPQQKTLAEIAFIYLVSIALYSLALLSSYFEGMVPVLQGRFLLPVVLPVVLLVVWGLWLYPKREALCLGLATVLWGVSFFFLFGNLVPYFYYWSERVAGNIDHVVLYSWQGVVFVYQRALLDKPAFLSLWLIAVPLLCLVTLLYTLRYAWQLIVATPVYSLSDSFQDTDPS